MAMYYKFRSEKNYDSIPVHTPFISVWDLKILIFHAKKMGKGTDLLLTNAQINEDYYNEATLVPRNTMTLVRRIPAALPTSIIVEPERSNEADSEIETSKSRCTLSVANSDRAISIPGPNNLSYPLNNVPPELHCPLCKGVMKEAALTSRCCFWSYCDKRIRDHIISKSACACGETGILADSLIPNMAVREVIQSFLRYAEHGEHS